MDDADVSPRRLDLEVVEDFWVQKREDDHFL